MYLLLLALGFASRPAAAEFPFVVGDTGYVLKAGGGELRLLESIAPGCHYRTIPIRGVAGRETVRGVHVIDRALSASGTPYLAAWVGSDFSVISISIANDEAELEQVWRARVEPPMNFAVVRDGVFVIGGVEPVVVTKHGWCRLPSDMRGYNVAANADGVAIFFQGTSTLVADIDYRTCHLDLITTRKFSPRYVVDVEPFRDGWLAVMGSSKPEESLLAVLDRNGEVVRRYDLPLATERYELVGGQDGVFVAASANSMFGYDGHSFRRLQSPVGSRVVEGASLRAPVVHVGGEFLPVEWGGPVPGEAVRSLNVGLTTVILDLTAYRVALAVFSTVLLRLSSPRVVSSVAGGSERRGE